MKPFAIVLAAGTLSLCATAANAKNVTVPGSDDARVTSTLGGANAQAAEQSGTPQGRDPADAKAAAKKPHHKKNTTPSPPPMHDPN